LSELVVDELEFDELSVFVEVQFDNNHHNISQRSLVVSCAISEALFQALYKSKAISHLLTVLLNLFVFVSVVIQSSLAFWK